MIYLDTNNSTVIVKVRFKLKLISIRKFYRLMKKKTGKHLSNLPVKVFRHNLPEKLHYTERNLVTRSASVSSRVAS